MFSYKLLYMLLNDFVPIDKNKYTLTRTLGIAIIITSFAEFSKGIDAQGCVIGEH